MSKKWPHCAGPAAGEDHRFGPMRKRRSASRSRFRSSPKGPAVSSGSVTTSLRRSRQEGGLR